MAVLYVVFAMFGHAWIIMSIKYVYKTSYPVYARVRVCLT